MLSNTLPLVGTDATFDARRFEEANNRTTYIFTGHSSVAKNTMALYRTPAKRVGEDKGRERRSAKFTETVTVKSVSGLDVQQDIIIELSLSVPVGAHSATIAAARGKVRGLIDHAEFVNFVELGEI